MRFGHGLLDQGENAANRVVFGGGGGGGQRERRGEEMRVAPPLLTVIRVVGAPHFRLQETGFPRGR